MLALPSIMVKAVVDFANTQKNDQYHSFGAKIAAAFLLEFLQQNLPLARPTATDVAATTSISHDTALATKGRRSQPAGAIGQPKSRGVEWLLLRLVTGGADVLETLLRAELVDPTLKVRANAKEPLLAHVTSQASTLKRVRDLVQRRGLSPPLARLVRYVARNAGTDSDDQNEGKFGRSPYRNGRLLWATVRTLSPRWYEVEISISALDAKDLEGKAASYLHSSFPETILRAIPRDGKATISIECYGSFVVGAVIDDGRTRLELDLDLGGLPGVPRGFIDE